MSADEVCSGTGIMTTVFSAVSLAPNVLLMRRVICVAEQHQSFDQTLHWNGHGNDSVECVCFNETCIRGLGLGRPQLAKGRHGN